MNNRLHDIKKFNVIYKEKYATNIELPVLKNIYQRYLSYKVSLTKDKMIRPSFFKIVKDKLIALHDQNLSNYEPIYTDSLNYNKNICAYCFISEADEVDHFLPKAIYPEFVIYPSNLLPACSKCNKKRPRSFNGLYKKSGKEVRVNINIKYDNFITKMFYFETYWISPLTFINIKISYTNIKPVEKEIVKEHFDKFVTKNNKKLLQAYSELISYYFNQVTQSHIKEVYNYSNFDKYWVFLLEKFEQKLKYDKQIKLWLNESYQNKRLNLNGYKDYINYIFQNKNNLNNIIIEKTILDILRNT